MYSRQDGFYNICITGRDTTSVKTLMILGIFLSCLSQEGNIHYAQGSNSTSFISQDFM